MTTTQTRGPVNPAPFNPNAEGQSTEPFNAPPATPDEIELDYAILVGGGSMVPTRGTVDGGTYVMNNKGIPVLSEKPKYWQAAPDDISVDKNMKVFRLNCATVECVRTGQMTAQDFARYIIGTRWYQNGQIVPWSTIVEMQEFAVLTRSAAEAFAAKQAEQMRQKDEKLGIPSAASANGSQSRLMKAITGQQIASSHEHVRNLK